MKNFLVILALALNVAVTVPSVSFAVSAETEKNFVDTYKKAFEGKDAATLQSLLYTKGADPMALEFFNMMLTADMGGKVTSIELKDLTPEEVTAASAVHAMPDGSNSKLPVSPIKKLVLKTAAADANGSSSASSESFVAEVDGKLVIPVPVPAK